MIVRATRYIIKTDRGYVTNHRHGRMTKNVASAKTFATYAGASSNHFVKFKMWNPSILTVDITMDVY